MRARLCRQYSYSTSFIVVVKNIERYYDDDVLCMKKNLMIIRSTQSGW